MHFGNGGNSGVGQREIWSEKNHKKTTTKLSPHCGLPHYNSSCSLSSWRQRCVDGDRFSRGVRGPGDATCRLKGKLFWRLGGTFDAPLACSCSSSCPGKKRSRRSGGGWRGGAETTRKKVTVSKPDAPVAVGDSEEGRGCIICLPHVRIRSENTHRQPVSPHTHLDLCDLSFFFFLSWQILDWKLTIFFSRIRNIIVTENNKKNTQPYTWHNAEAKKI